MIEKLLINILLSYLGSLSFGIIINVQRRLLNAAGLTGVSGWLVYILFRDLDLGVFISNFMGAFVMGLVSYVFARYKKVPVLNFNVSGLICLAPGALAYEGLHDVVFKGVNHGLNTVVRVMVVVLALAVGTMLSQLVYEALKQIIKKVRA